MRCATNAAGRRQVKTLTPPGPDEQTNNDEDDAPENLAAEQRDNATNYQQYS
jgi:hypothetical protein